jgi:hypothetical protein
MNTALLLAAAAFNMGGGGLSGLLIGFLIIIVVIAIIAGLIYAIETWIIKGSIPAPIKLVIGLVLIVLVVIWAIQHFGGG